MAIQTKSTAPSTVPDTAARMPSPQSSPFPQARPSTLPFTLYSVEWTPDDLKFFIDDHLITHRTPADLPPGTHWVFDHPFFIILNLATGGDWPGDPDKTTTFPQQMVVDYVRVYKSNQTQARQTPVAAATSKPLQ